MLSLLLLLLLSQVEQRPCEHDQLMPKPVLSVATGHVAYHTAEHTTGNTAGHSHASGRWMGR
jgi:hypothetical protein